MSRRGNSRARQRATKERGADEAARDNPSNNSPVTDSEVDPVRAEIAGSREVDTTDIEQTVTSSYPELRPEDMDALLDCLKSELSGLSTDVLLGQLKQLPQPALSYVMTYLGLAKAARVNRGMAAALLSRLRSRPSADLLAFVLKPFFDVFAHSHLADDQWAALLSGDWHLAVCVFEDNPAFTWHLLRGERQVHTDLVGVGLTVAALNSSVGAVPAFAFLARENDTAGTAYKELQGEYPELPTAEWSFRALLPSVMLESAPDSDAAARLADALERAVHPTTEPRAEDEADDSAWDDVATSDSPGASLADPPLPESAAADMNDQQEHPGGSRRAAASAGPGVRQEAGVDVPGFDAPAHEAAVVPEDANVAATAAAAATSVDWELAEATAEQVAERLRARAVPDWDDLEDLTAFANETRDLAVTLSELTGMKVEPNAVSLAAAAKSVAEGAARIEQLRALAHANGPAEIDTAVEDLRTLAKRALTGEVQEDVIAGLLAVAQLATLGCQLREGTSREYGLISQVESTARTHLPGSILPAVTAGLLGDLRLNPATDEVEFTTRASTGLNEPLTTAPVLDTPEVVHDLTVTTQATDTVAPADNHAETNKGRAAAQAAATEKDGLPAKVGPPTEAAPDVDTVAVEGGGGDTITSGQPESDIEVGDGELDLSQLSDFMETEAAGSARIKTTSPKPGEPRTEHPAPLRGARAEPIREDEPDPARGAVVGFTDENGAAVRDPLQSDPAQLQEAEAALIQQGRFGLASLLHQAPAHAAARRLAAYQVHLTSATGELASAFADDQPLINRDVLGDDRAGQLLAWAAAARVAVVAPASGASEILDELTPSLADYPHLTQAGHELAVASRSGAIALPEHSGDVSAQHRASEVAHDAADRARDLLDVAPRRNTKYAPATAVYHHWMSAEGVLGHLLGQVVGNDPSTADHVRAEIVELRRGVDKRIDETLRLVVRSTKGRRIEAGARQKLTQWLHEALDVAAEWAEATTTATQLREQLRGAARAAGPLDKLRATLEQVHDAALDEIETMRAACDLETAAGRQEVAAVAALASMVIATFDTCNGNPPQGAEPSPAWLVRGELLGTDTRLDATTLQPIPPTDGSTPENPEAIAQRLALKMARADPASSGEMYARRAERAEHDLTEVIVENVARLDPDAAALLRAERETDVAETAAQVAKEVADVTDLVNSRRRDESLPENAWSTLLAALEPMRRPDRRDFATIRLDLDRIRETVEGHTRTLVDEARRRVESRAQESPLVAEHRARLLALLDSGDVAGADEFLEQLTSEGCLPQPRHDDVHLGRFFPAVPALASAHPRLLEELHTALGKLDQAPSAAVADLFAAAHVDPPSLADAPRPLGRSAVGAWLQLAQAPTHQSVDVSTTLKAILAAMGLEFAGSAEMDKPHRKNRRTGTLRDVDGIGKAMVPALGSQMGGQGAIGSRSRRTLRVMLIWEHVAPSTLVDWLSKEQDDQTVLVLYLAGALTVEQRVALATAARGQSRPVGIVVDTAVLAYLACQSEPSRTTLAFLTLPFTAASPYRDTPGDTPREMFYGRVTERQAVMDLAGSSFVSGGRQLGKSALLRTAMRSFDNGSTRRSLLIEVRQVGAAGDPEMVWPILNAELRASGIVASNATTPATADTVSETIRGWLAEDPDRALLILVDEADNFLAADAAGNRFINVGACKRLMESEGRRVKFVFAGLHRTSRFKSLSNQPLAHMGLSKPIIVGPLRAQAAQDLVTQPMAALGFTFADASAQTARILAATNSVPSLLQLFGQALVEHMTSQDVGDGPPQQVTDDDIATVLAHPELAEAFREKYILTLNLDHRYQVIVHAVALSAYEHGVDAGVTLRELDNQCREYWPAGFADLPLDYLRGLVAECCDLGLLTEESGRYRMRTPYVLRLLGSVEDVTEVLLHAEERLTLPSSLDAGSYRDPIGSGSSRSPLTARQVGNLFETAGRTHVLVGSEALSAGRVVGYLEQLAVDGRTIGYAVHKVANLTATGLVSAAGLATRPTMLVMDLRAASTGQLQAVLDSTEEAHAAAASDLIVTVVAATTNAPAWQATPETLVELTRVDLAGLRLWCDETDSTFDAPDLLGQLAAGTGGWPLLVERVLRRTESGMPTPARRRLSDLIEWLDTPAGAQTLVAACGLAGDTAPVTLALHAVFARAAAWTTDAGAPWDDLVDLLSGPDEQRLLEHVREAGFAEVVDVLQVLRLTGMLQEEAAGDVSVEPVLARAVQVVGGVDTPEAQ